MVYSRLLMSASHTIPFFSLISIGLSKRLSIEESVIRLVLLLEQLKGLLMEQVLWLLLFGSAAMAAFSRSAATAIDLEPLPPLHLQLNYFKDS